MINKNIKKYLAIIIVFFIFLSGNFCYASFLKPETKNEVNIQAGMAGELGGYETASNVYELAQIVINTFLSIIGVILLAYLLYAGYKWMTAHGEEEKVEKAKDTIKRAITGIIIIVGAYAISVFVMGRLEAPLKGGASTTQSATQQGN